MSDENKERFYRNYNLGFTNSGNLVRGTVNVFAKSALYRGTGMRKREEWDCPCVSTRIFIPIAEESYFILDDVQIKVTQKKVITKTVVTGLVGTVKEYISDGDYTLTLTCGVGGVTIGDGGEIYSSYRKGKYRQTSSLNNETDSYPVEKMQALLDFCRKGESMEIGCEFLESLYGINRIVVTGCEIDARTYSNREELTIYAISDRDYVILEEHI